MHTNEVLIDAFKRIKEAVHDAAEDLTVEQLTFRPNDTGNSIAWLIWHLTRVQDDHIADVASTEQVWLSEGWREKFHLPFDPSVTGYGQTADEVARVQAEASLLLGYHDAVHNQTITYLNQLTNEDYAKIVDTNWNPPVTLAVRLISVISDDLQHAGQAAYVRGLL